MDHFRDLVNRERLNARVVCRTKCIRIRQIRREQISSVKSSLVVYLFLVILYIRRRLSNDALNDFYVDSNMIIARVRYWCQYKGPFLCTVNSILFWHMIPIYSILNSVSKYNPTYAYVDLVSWNAEFIYLYMRGALICQLCPVFVTSSPGPFFHAICL
jgi:hypothetical protein